MKASAIEIGNKAIETIGHRAVERDSQDGERSMAKTVAAFNALRGHNLSEVDGWLFMAILKMARASKGRHQLDDYVDGSAYFMLAGECAENG